MAAACDAVHEDAANLPVIAFVDDGDDAGVGAVDDAADPSVAAELASRDHCRYLPREAPPAAVGAAVDDALATFDRRRREAAESSLFRTLLSDSDVPIFAKDEGGTRVDIRKCNVISGTPAEAVPASRIDLSSTADVGQSTVPGSAAYDADSDRWRVSGAGKNVWGDANEFHFVYGTAEAPARIEGRIDGLDGIHEFSKAALAIRASPDADAPFGYVGTTEAHGSEVLWRLTATPALTANSSRSAHWPSSGTASTTSTARSPAISPRTGRSGTPSTSDPSTSV